MLGVLAGLFCDVSMPVGGYACRKSNPDVLMVSPPTNWATKNAQAMKLKRLSEEAYRPKQFERDLSQAEPTGGLLRSRQRSS
jgi:hypothetical protein